MTNAEKYKTASFLKEIKNKVKEMGETKNKNTLLRIVKREIIEEVVYEL